MASRYRFFEQLFALQYCNPARLERQDLRASTYGRCYAFNQAAKPCEVESSSLEFRAMSLFILRRIPTSRSSGRHEVSTTELSYRQIECNFAYFELLDSAVQNLRLASLLPFGSGECCPSTCKGCALALILDGSMLSSSFHHPHGTHRCCATIPSDRQRTTTTSGITIGVRYEF